MQSPSSLILRPVPLPHLPPARGAPPRSRASVLVLGALLVGCRSYEPLPLDPLALVGEADRMRRGPADAEALPGSPVTFAEALAWMRAQGPDLQEAIAAYRTALARARVPTPLPNPSIEAGLEHAFGSDVEANDLVPFGALSWAIPLGDRRAAQDALHARTAELARADGIARYQEIVLELRARWITALLARQIALAHEDLARAAERSVAVSRRMIEAGQATALDHALLQLERLRSRSEHLVASASAAEALAALAGIVGVRADRLQNLATEDRLSLPETLPDLDELRLGLAEHHPTLARLRAQYEQAEAALRLEISRQYPDLRFGPSAGGEAGERKTLLGLSVGIDLPIFDRNGQAIAEAEGRREELRARFLAASNRALAELERAWQGTALARRRRELLQETLLPEAGKNLELAHESVNAGAGDALRLLEAERSHRLIVVQALEAALAEQQAWVELERAAGRPLARFPSESAEPPPIPPGLEPDVGAAGPRVLEGRSSP